MKPSKNLVIYYIIVIVLLVLISVCLYFIFKDRGSKNTTHTPNVKTPEIISLPEAVNEILKINKDTMANNNKLIQADKAAKTLTTENVETIGIYDWTKLKLSILNKYFFYNSYDVGPFLTDYIPSGITPSNLVYNEFNYDVAMYNLYLISNAYYIYNYFSFIDKNFKAPQAISFLQTKIDGVDNIDLLYYNSMSLMDSTTKFGGILFKKNNTVYIVLRGTLTLSEMYIDAQLSLTNEVSWLESWTDQTVYLHSGFNYFYSNEKKYFPTSLRKQIFNYLEKNADDKTKIIVTGHSLGGALVYLTIADLIRNSKYPKTNIQGHVYAGPYSGNFDFCNIIDTSDVKLFNFMDSKDIVSMAQLPGYSRTIKGNYCFTLLDPVEFNHLIPLYVRGIASNKTEYEKCSDQYCGTENCKNMYKLIF